MPGRNTRSNALAYGQNQYLGDLVALLDGVRGDLDRARQLAPGEGVGKRVRIERRTLDHAIERVADVALLLHQYADDPRAALIWARALQNLPIGRRGGD